ncbi:unnamed protein product [Echinostoma caproni]|uniref:Dehydrogenase/reductase SDR family member on chromosome X n=1 Tax=Echinostoma caproni TaxID=27848 RepID=A0A183AA79_9TREM|nr:unnamed protein product [Echinostoma caproni]
MLRWFYRRPVSCTCVSRVSRHAVITGATSGLGRATAFELARHNWRLTLGCRNLNAAKQLIEEIIAKTGNDKLEAKHLDLVEPSSILRFANSFQHEIDVLINNAGVMARDPRPVNAFGGLNVDTVTNYLGPFYLTQLMIPKLKVMEEKSHYPRIIFVSSSLAKKGSVDELLNAETSRTEWNSSQAYANSKLAVCFYARELHRCFGSGEEKKLNVYCLFIGGMVHTNLSREIISKYPTLLQPILRLISRLLLKSPAEGCQGILHCAISDAVPMAHLIGSTASITDLSGSGLLYSGCVPIPWPSIMQDVEKQHGLWKTTMQFLSLKVD